MKIITKFLIGVLLLNILFQLAPGQIVSANSDNNKVDENWLENKRNAEENEKPTVSTSENNNGDQAVGLTVFDYIKTLFFLIVVLAILIYVLKFINKKSVKYNQNSIAQNLGGTSLGAQKSVQLLLIGNKIYVVGVGEDVQLIKEITDPNEVEEIINQYNEKLTISTSTPKFIELVKKLLLKNKNSDVPSENEMNFEKILRKNISAITKERRNELEKWKEKEHDK